MDRDQKAYLTWDKVASAYQDKFMDLHLYDDTYDAFCGLIKKPGARIFEIACGPGNITRYLLSKRPDFRIEAIDISPAMIALAQANNPAADFKVMDCREIYKVDRGFDGIICGFCLPYLSKDECARLMADCSDRLGSGGIVYFSAIEGDYTASGFEWNSSREAGMYVYYHEEQHLLQALNEAGIEPIILSKKEYPESAQSPSMHMIFIGRKK